MKTPVSEMVESKFVSYKNTRTLVDAKAFKDLEDDIEFILRISDLLIFCEKETVLGLFRSKKFSKLPDAQRIESKIQEHMLQYIINVYLAAAARIKKNHNAGPLEDKEVLAITGEYDKEKGIRIPGLGEHIAGVFTSLLQMYYATIHEPVRLDGPRLQLGSLNVTTELVNIFKNLHSDVNDPKLFKKWAFISLFHDIAKIEETYSTLKHDVTSARFLVEENIFKLLSLPEEEQEEILVIIKKHVEIGCHGPGDQSIFDLFHIFNEPDINKLFTHDGGNINPDLLYHFLSNALLMWTHDSAGTTRRGLATVLPFIYLKDIFDKILEITKSKNITRDLADIETDIKTLAKNYLYQRIGRIVCAWLYSEFINDKECMEQFKQALEAITPSLISEADKVLFEDYFPLISGKNHLFNILIHPIREAYKFNHKRPVDIFESYKKVAKGFVFLTKALSLLNCTDIRAVNAKGTMEFSSSNRDKMACELAKTIDLATDVRLLNGHVVFSFTDEFTKKADITFILSSDSVTQQDVLLLKICL